MASNHRARFAKLRVQPFPGGLKYRRGPLGSKRWLSLVTCCANSTQLLRFDERVPQFQGLPRMKIPLLSGDAFQMVSTQPPRAWDMQPLYSHRNGHTPMSSGGSLGLGVKFNLQLDVNDASHNIGKRGCLLSAWTPQNRGFPCGFPLKPLKKGGNKEKTSHPSGSDSPLPSPPPIFSSG